MGRVHDVTIPTRFILTLGHFIVTILALFHKVGLGFWLQNLLL